MYWFEFVSANTTNSNKYTNSACFFEANSKETNKIAASPIHIPLRVSCSLGFCTTFLIVLQNNEKVMANPMCLEIFWLATNLFLGFVCYLLFTLFSISDFKVFYDFIFSICSGDIYDVNPSIFISLNFISSYSRSGWNYEDA